jgi:hypothetical protein
MLGTYLINEVVLRIVESAANVVLRAMGGPDHVPSQNEDFVWF